MQIKTEAIVLHSIRYGEADLIVKLFTRNEGVNTYLIRGVLKNKKNKISASFFQPLSILEIDAIHSNKSTLFRLKEAKPLYHYKSLHTHIIKGGIAAFISEILTQTLKDNEGENGLFDFLKQSFFWLDDSNNFTLFNQLFLTQLSYFIGFYPDTTDNILPEFNLAEGNFQIVSNTPYSIKDNRAHNLKTVLGTNFDNLKTIVIPKTERLQLLDDLLLYYTLHIEGFKKPKSLTVLKGLFS